MMGKDWSNGTVYLLGCASACMNEWKERIDQLPARLNRKLLCICWVAATTEAYSGLLSLTPPAILEKGLSILILKCKLEGDDNNGLVADKKSAGWKKGRSSQFSFSSANCKNMSPLRGQMHGLKYRWHVFLWWDKKIIYRYNAHAFYIVDSNLYLTIKELRFLSKKIHQPLFWTVLPFHQITWYCKLPPYRFLLSVSPLPEWFPGSFSRLELRCLPPFGRGRK
jgi:hypothetical protein